MLQAPGHACNSRAAIKRMTDFDNVHVHLAIHVHVHLAIHVHVHGKSGLLLRI